MLQELAAVALFVPGVFATPLGRVLLAVLLIAIVVLVGKFILSLAWRLLVIAAFVVGALVLLTLLL